MQRGKTAPGRKAGKRVASRERERRIETPTAQRLVREARVLVYRAGVKGTRLSDVAARAGQALGSPYYYFGTKGRLIVEVLRVDHDQRVAALHSDFASAVTFERTVDACMASKRTFVSHSGGRSPYDVLEEARGLAASEPEVASALVAFVRGYRQAMADLLRLQEQRKIVALGGGDPEQIAVLLVALGQAIGAEGQRNPEWDTEAALQLARGAVAHLLGTSRLASRAGFPI